MIKSYSLLEDNKNYGKGKHRAGRDALGMLEVEDGICSMRQSGQEDRIEKVTFEQRFDKECFRQENKQWKGPEVKLGLACSRNNMKLMARTGKGEEVVWTNPIL